MPLFTRGARRLTPTEAALALREHAELAVSAIARRRRDRRAPSTRWKAGRARSACCAMPHYYACPTSSSDSTDVTRRSRCRSSG